MLGILSHIKSIETVFNDDILFQYKRDEPIEHSLNYTNPAVQDHHNHNHISHHLRYQRRTSLDSGSDSSSESEGKLSFLRLYFFLGKYSLKCEFRNFETEVIRTEGKRRRYPRTVEQCEREIQRLQSSLDTLRSQVGDENGSDIGGRDSNDDPLSAQNSDIKMRGIIAK